MYRRHMNRLCEVLKEKDVPVEINVLGLATGRHYPSRRFLELAKRALEILKDMDESQRRALSRDLTTVIKQIKELHEEDEESDVSIGIDRVLGLYKLSNSRRWYDKVSILSYAMKTMSTLPKEDFYTIMEGITVSAGTESVA